MIAFATVLSEIKILEMPMGGTITAFSMLPILIIAYRYGVKWVFSLASPPVSCKCCWECKI